MRRWGSIARATALEMLSEPLSLLVLLTALTMAVLAPAFHYHQFGEATRMARDAGFSALLTGGSVLAVFGTIRAFRREIESGTLAMALSHPISRGGFFLAKTLGAIVAYLVFAGIVVSTMLVIVQGAAIGGAIARRTGDIARLWAPCLAVGVATMLVPLMVAALLNRFARFRFVLSCFAIALAMSVVSAALVTWMNPKMVLRLLPVALLVIVPPLLYLLAAAAFSVRLKANAAASAVGLVFVASVPAIGNYYLVDALSKGGSLPLDYLAFAILAALPAMLAMLALGMGFMGKCDIS